MRKSIIEIVKETGKHETYQYRYERMDTPNGFIILRHNKLRPGYPCVIYRDNKSVVPVNYYS